MITIGIDGPSGAGKSVTAKNLSEKLNILHLNTGALYRAIAVYLDENNIPADNEQEVEKVLNNINVSINFSDGKQHTLLNGEDVSHKLYNSVIGQKSSQCSAIKHVREKMLDIQRDIAKNNSVIMEGRDITTHVLPTAKFKFFLTASLEVRAERRFKDLVKDEPTLTYEQVLSDLKERDVRDTTRSLSPLKVAEDAIYINSDNLTQEQVIEYMYNIVTKENK